MTSTNNVMDINSITLQLRELITINREQIADMKTLSAQMQKDNAEFRTQITKDFANFKDSIDSRLTEIHTEITQINQRITGLEHDVSGLYHWNYWLLSIILVVIALPHLVDIIKSVVGAVTYGITSLAAIFKKESSTNNK